MTKTNDTSKFSLEDRPLDDAELIVVTGGEISLSFRHFDVVYKKD